MVSILRVENAKSRTFGWVQDPSDFRSLCNVVSVFDRSSAKHIELVEAIIPNLVSVGDGRDALISALNAEPLKIAYANLVGTAFNDRKTSRCNGIIQAVVKGQGRDFIGNWPADNFVRWAHCLGFISYDYSDDTFEITQSGLKLTAVCAGTEELSDLEQNIIKNAMLSYAPAIRVLSLLSENNSHLTKFEIGRQLGFIGESGFGNMPQSVLIRSLAGINNAKEKNKMRTTWEGASDKYARTIARWLTKLGLVQNIEKRITVTVGSSDYVETIGQAYMITAQGVTALNSALGRSRHPRIRKNICFEMLATKGADREYLRIRRALLIKKLSEHKGNLTTDELLEYLATQNVSTSKEAIHDDIQGLINIGLDISVDSDSLAWQDVINDFVIPIRAEVAPSLIEQTKDNLREKISHISHDYLSLLDLAYDSKQYRLFEMKTLQLLTEECGYLGTHLGGGRKPDGVIYTKKLENNYGVIVDTKSYPKGYNLPIAQADEMQRYVQENQRRDAEENPNKWWENFGDDVRQFYFMFVAGHFTGKYQDQIDRISRITTTHGAAVEIVNLLLAADKIKCDAYSHRDVEVQLFR